MLPLFPRVQRLRLGNRRGFASSAALLWVGHFNRRRGAITFLSTLYFAQCVYGAGQNLEGKQTEEQIFEGKRVGNEQEASKVRSLSEDQVPS